MIRCIIFDLGNVIIPDDTPLIRKEVAQEMGIDVSELDEFMKEIHPQLTQGHISILEVYELLVRRLNKSHIPKKLLETHLTVFSRRMLTPYADVISFVDELHKTYKIACLTNTEIEAMVLFKKIGLFKHFDYVFSSVELKMLKPNADIYRTVLKTLSCAPKEAVFTDDKIENVSGANAVGIHAIHYQNLAQFKRELNELIDKNK